MFKDGTGWWWRLWRLRLRVPQAEALQGQTYNVSRFPVITVNKQIISNSQAWRLGEGALRTAILIYAIDPWIA